MSVDKIFDLTAGVHLIFYNNAAAVAVYCAVGCGCCIPCALFVSIYGWAAGCLAAQQTLVLLLQCTCTIQLPLRDGHQDTKVTWHRPVINEWRERLMVCCSTTTVHSRVWRALRSISWCGEAEHPAALPLGGALYVYTIDI